MNENSIDDKFVQETIHNLYYLHNYINEQDTHLVLIDHSTNDILHYIQIVRHTYILHIYIYIYSIYQPVLNMSNPFLTYFDTCKLLDPYSYYIHRHTYMLNISLKFNKEVHIIYTDILYISKNT